MRRSRHLWFRHLSFFFHLSLFTRCTINGRFFFHRLYTLFICTMETRFYRLHMVICFSSINNKQRVGGAKSNSGFFWKQRKDSQGFPYPLFTGSSGVVVNDGITFDCRPPFSQTSKKINTNSKRVDLLSRFFGRSQPSSFPNCKNTDTTGVWHGPPSA